jgi:hypothetical protein
MNNYICLGLGLFFYTNPCFAGSDITTAKVGLGIGSGTTTSALTAKKYTDKNKAFQLFFGTQGVSTFHSFSLGGDVLFEYPIQEIDIGKLFYGFGAGVGIFSYGGIGFQASSIGVSGVGELGLHLAEIPLEIIIDLRPTIFIGDVAGLSLFAGGGAVRWYF